MTKIILVAVVLLLLGGGAYLFLRKGSNQGTAPTTNQEGSGTSASFSNSKKAAHYESNTPEHGAILAGVPINVVINFNFDLANPSETRISGTTAPSDVGSGDTVVDANKLSMRRAIRNDAPDGIYTVNYTACWADGSCHDGQFQFKIDRSLVTEFEDLTGKDEVTINLKNFAFNPTKVKVSKGTKVIWVNQDNIIHTVNTDSHPGHNYFPGQNSRDLSKGDTYSVTFDREGISPYHCTPHPAPMKGQVLVR